jgi:hypothetical protein
MVRRVDSGRLKQRWSKGKGRAAGRKIVESRELMLWKHLFGRHRRTTADSDRGEPFIMKVVVHCETVRSSLFKRAFAVSTMCSAVKPNSRMTTGPGAEAPKCAVPIIAPSDPT